MSSISIQEQALRILEEEKLCSFYEEQKRTAAATAAAEAAHLQAELKRLRARSEIEILRDEVAQMRAEQMAALKACHLARLPLQEIPRGAFGELGLHANSSKEELATARGEIAELKALLHAVIGRLGSIAGVNIRNCDRDENGARLRNYILAHHDPTLPRDHTGGHQGPSNVHSIYLG